MHTTHDIKPGTFKYIESEIYNLQENKKEINRLRLEILNPLKETDTNIIYGPLQKGEPVRTTELMATRLLTNKMLRNLEEMVEAVESEYERLPEEHKKVIRLKYWNKDRKLKMEQIGEECHMHRNTVTTIRRNYVKAVAMHVGIK
ncbi:transcriptional regulator [Staphylococcus simiae]|uniref:Prophage L54a, RinA family transcriptional regulator n=1 Tax=Staphylococcus simiae CCM 7213 = CCUG 51256 TaxID=911238 RepID=G5JH78_9STAP|nr:transcriptional regulator [Staphylococcus simiae]EHJ08426.1 prophage L54a, RinA family transcriptional regulator [Staphylococcus simiae CCM 7213 = CCUG 51256]PNZ12619.1 transcriptional regulator [Staphylococcus simiae]SNV67240.1 phage regulatory protein [Staphylococcus simiae]